MTTKNILRNGITLQRVRNKRGQTLVEYALILAFISVVGISTLIATGTQIKGTFTTIDSQLASAGNGGAAPATGGSGSGSGHGG